MRYSGGLIKNPTCEQVCAGTAGHAQVLQITSDLSEISYEETLQTFFAAHDLTTLNRQGNDIGSNYRSIILYHSSEQRETAEIVIEKITREDIFGKPIVTEVKEFTLFFPAEDRRKNYFADNPNQPYCSAVVAPKVAKFGQNFWSKLRK